MNTAKKAQSSRNWAWAMAREKGLDLRTAWEEAWASRPVPGFKTFDIFWQSELGLALRRPQAVGTVPLSLEEAHIIEVQIESEEADAEASLIKRDRFEAVLAQGKTQGVLDEFEAWALKALRLEDASLAELRESDEARDHFGETPSVADWEAWIDNLIRRLRGFDDE